MKNQRRRLYLLSLFLLMATALILTGCYNSGVRFFRDVNETVCCFSPALAVAPAVLMLLIAPRGQD